MTKKDLVWRLSQKPSVGEVVDLVNSKIITPEEAKTIVFNLADENDKITKLEQEVELLKNALSDTRKGVALNRSWVEMQPMTMVDPFKVFRGLIDL